jgi:hypothetical protein
MVGLIVLAASWGSGAENAKTAAQTFKNVQVLKEISADELVPAMQFITASLGVECDFCHVRDAFDKDDKPPKKTARRMMQMMEAINSNNFGQQRAVTCFTCHRGSLTPLSIPMLDIGASYVSEFLAKPAASHSELPPADQVLQNYVDAIGGEAAISKISSRLEKGSVSFGAGPAFPVEILTKNPGKRIMMIHLAAGDSSTAFDGEKGWSRDPGSPIREMHASDFEGARLDADLQFAIHLKQRFQEIRTVKAEKLGDRDVFLLFASNPGQPPLELYLDRETGLLLRELRFASSPLGLNPTILELADYKEQDGVRVPGRISINRPNRRLDIRISQLEQNVPIDDAIFEHK